MVLQALRSSGFFNPNVLRRDGPSPVAGTHNFQLDKHTYVLWVPSGASLRHQCLGDVPETIWGSTEIDYLRSRVQPRLQITEQAHGDVAGPKSSQEANL